MSVHVCSFMLLFVLMMCHHPVARVLRCCWFASVEDPLGLLQQPLWNHSPFCLLTFLLLLSGDVQPNPGLDTSGLEFCSVCKDAVLDDHKAVCCDLCDS